MIVDMVDYVEKMVDEFPEKLKSTHTAMSPADAGLFELSKGGVLDKKRSEDFHTWVVKGLFVCKRARQDIQTAIAVLATKVTEPKMSDWNCLVRLMRYLNGTRK